MTVKGVTEIESIVRKWAVAKPLIREIYLFGSRIKGAARPDSDVDLAIAADHRAGDSGATTVHFETARWEAELTKLLGVAADVEELSDAHVAKYVQEASKPIYRRWASARGAYSALTEATREASLRHGIGTLTRVLDWDKFRSWIVDRVATFQPGAPAARDAGRLVDELYWAFVDLQICICHVLVAYDTSLLHRGVDEVQFNDIDLPELGAIDGLFLFYVSMAWEQVYRVWSRYENVVRFMFFGEIGRPPQGSPSDLGGILERIKREYPSMAQMTEYEQLRSLVEDRNRVAERRNQHSHRENSPFHAIMGQELQISDILQPSGTAVFTFKLKWPDPTETVQELKNCYAKADSPWGTTLLKFMDAAHKTKRAGT